MLKTLPKHTTCGIERSPCQSKNSFSTVERHRRCFFAHLQDSEERDSLQVDAPCQPCKRRLLAFHRGVHFSRTTRRLRVRGDHPQMEVSRHKNHLTAPGWSLGSQVHSRVTPVPWPLTLTIWPFVWPFVRTVVSSHVFDSTTIVRLRAFSQNLQTCVWYWSSFQRHVCHRLEIRPLQKRTMFRSTRFFHREIFDEDLLKCEGFFTIVSKPFLQVSFANLMWRVSFLRYGR